jgi:hypothetical protein
VSKLANILNIFTIGSYLTNMNPEQISRINEHFQIDQDTFEKTGCFNAVIGVDRPFFLDPTLLEETTIPEFRDAKANLDQFFSNVLTLIATNHVRGIVQARRLMTLREIRGVGIGYGARTDDGSAIGKRLAERLVTSAQQLLQMGFNDPAIFHLMGLFEEDFGPDRISDAMINILQDSIYAYTARVAGELGIPCTRSVVTLRTRQTFVLPEHPSGNKPLVLVPQSLLRDIPIALTPEEIPDVAAYNEELREQFNRLLAPILARTKRPTKHDIRSYLFENPERITTLLKGYKASHPPHYDFEKDPSGLQRWLDESSDAVKEVPVDVPTEIATEADVLAVVDSIIKAFKRFIETKGGWRGLYDEKYNRLHEEHACLLFYAMALKYCADSNIDISPQSNAGQGPVDFKLSRGTSKVVVEMKLTSGNVRQGYEKQTGIYQSSEDAQHAYFVVVQVTDTSKALDDVIKQAEQEDKDEVKHPELVVVDGRPKESASKAK